MSTRKIVSWMPRFFLTAITSLSLADLAFCQEPPQQEDPYVTDACGPPKADAMIEPPWQSITLDREYGGQWIVAGDVDGDREIEIVSAQNFNQNDNHFTSAVVVHKLDGSVLWRWGDSALGRAELHHDVACQIHDLDHNGTNEVILAGDRKLIVLDGRTGKPTGGFAIEQHASDCVAFADLAGKGWPAEILVKTRYGQIWAYAADGRLLWTVNEPGGYRTSHQPFPIDLDGDGRDEILAGYAALNPDGSLRWVFEADSGRRNGGHADCWRVVRLAERPADTRLVMTMCGGNALVMTDGDGRLIWRQTGHHYESIDVGQIRPDLPGWELAVDVDHLPQPPKPLCLFDEQGREFGRINTDYTRHHTLVDWNGDGCQEIASALPRSLFDGHGRPVCTFAIGEGERPWLITTVDLDGRGRNSVLLATSQDGVYTVHLYRNHAAPAADQQRPTGTGLNFSLY